MEMTKTKSLSNKKFKATRQQEGIWFHAQMKTVSHWNFIQIKELTGALNYDMLEKALWVIIKEHISLRSTFRMIEDTLYQIENADFNIKEVYHRIKFEEEIHGNWDEFLEANIAKLRGYNFDFEKDFLIRLYCFENNASHCLVAVVNHIITDAISMRLFWDQLISNYNYFLEGYAYKPTKKNPVDYDTVATSQAKFIKSAECQVRKDYWVERLTRSFHRPQQPFLKSAPETLWYKSSLDLSQSDKNKITSFAIKNRVVYSSIFQLTLHILVRLFTNESKFLIENIISGRGRGINEKKNVLGLMANRLLLFHNIKCEDSALEAIKEVNHNFTEGFNNEVPYEILARELNESRKTGLVLSDIAFNFIKDFSADSHFNKLKEESTGKYSRLEFTNKRYDIYLIIIDKSDGIKVKLELRSSTHFPALIDLYLKSYDRILKKILLRPTSSINKIIHECSAELHGDLNLGEKVVDYKVKNSIVDVIRQAAGKYPDNIALSFQGSVMTYRELEDESNLLANYLRNDLGIKEDTLVPVCFERGFEMVVSILAILKAGCAYVPLSPEFPKDRIDYILRDINAELLLSHTQVKPIAENIGDVMIQWVDDILKDSQIGYYVDAPFSLAPKQLAYVIYTSGSTGKPKGVMIEHSALLNRLRWAQDEYNLTCRDVILQKTTYSFDVSVWEIFWPLMQGARIALADPDGHWDPGYLIDVIEQERVTLCHFVPSMLDIFVNRAEPGQCISLRHVLCSGEILKNSHVIKFQQKLPHIQLHNLYGPTEAAIDVTYYEVPKWFSNTMIVPIGKPVTNTFLHILDENMLPVQLGMPGELYISGAQVARGYVNNSELTATSFVQDIFANDDEQKMYKTGDVVRRLPDGNIEFLGRKDEQVKIRGNRVEILEIEKVLEGIPAIDASAVIMDSSEEGDNYLIAFITCSGSISISEIREILKLKLPAYMIPRRITEIDKFKLSVNGKVDKKELKRIESKRVIPIVPEKINRATVVNNQIEVSIIGQWEKMLNIKIHDLQADFFELGGHSLMAIKMLEQLKTEFQIPIPLKEFFKDPTVEFLLTKLNDKSS